MNVGPSPASRTPSIVSTLRLIVGDGICVALATARTLTSFLEATMDRVLERTEATTAVELLKHATGPQVPAAVRHRG